MFLLGAKLRKQNSRWKEVIKQQRWQKIGFGSIRVRSIRTFRQNGVTQTLTRIVIRTTSQDRTRTRLSERPTECSNLVLFSLLSFPWCFGDLQIQCYFSCCFGEGQRAHQYSMTYQYSIQLYKGKRIRQICSRNQGSHKANNSQREQGDLPNSRKN